MLLHQLLGDVESKPGPAGHPASGIGATERLENVRQLFRAHPDPVILHRERGLCPGLCDADTNLAALRRIFERIGDEVDDDLFKSCRIPATDESRGMVEVELMRWSSLGRMFETCDDLLDERHEIGLLHTQFDPILLDSRRVEEIVDHRVKTLNLTLKLVREALDGLRIAAIRVADRIGEHRCPTHDGR